MTGEISGPDQSNPFKVEYEPPTDLAGFEFELLDRYADKPTGYALAQNLAMLKRFAGIGIPQFSQSELISGESASANPDFEEGPTDFIELVSTMDAFSGASLMLQSPKPLLSPDEIDDMDQRDKYIFEATKTGLAVVGDSLPPEDVEMLNDIFRLIGAKKVRDDLDSDIRGSRIYQGNYMGADVFMEQSVTTNENVGEPFKVHSVWLHGAESGKIAVNSLSSADLERLRQAGENVFSANNIGLDKTNIDSYLEHKQEINNLVS